MFFFNIKQKSKISSRSLIKPTTSNKHLPASLVDRSTRHMVIDDQRATNRVNPCQLTINCSKSLMCRRRRKLGRHGSQILKNLFQQFFFTTRCIKTWFSHFTSLSLFERANQMNRNYEIWKITFCNWTIQNIPILTPKPPSKFWHCKTWSDAFDQSTFEFFIRPINFNVAVAQNPYRVSDSSCDSSG